MPKSIKNDRERELWVINDEGLYNWQKDSGLSMRNFLRQHRDELDQIIETAINKEPTR